MPRYRVTDPETGRTVTISGDSPPSEAELNEIFASVGGSSQSGGFMDDLKRQAGLTARAGLGGIAKIGTGINDAVNSAVNGVMGLVGSDYRQPMTSPMVDDALDAIGLPSPQNPQERVVNQASEFLSGGMVPVAAGTRLANASGPVARGVGEVLSSNPLVQAMSAVTGGASGGVANEMGAGPGAQIAATLGGSLVPSVGVSALQGATRGTLRGADPTQMRSNIESFREAGTAPSLGQATEGRMAQAAESVLSRTPGGAGPMRKFAEGQADDVSSTAESLANRLAPKSTPERAGIQIERGISGEGGFVDRFNVKAKQLYDAVDQYIDVQAPIALNNTKRIFSQPSAMSQNAPNVAKKLQSSYMRELGVELDNDVAAYLDANGFDGLPYAAVKEIRTAVGRRMNNGQLMDDAPNAELKRLYAALSDDLTVAAEQAGPQAALAAKRANSYWRAGSDRIERLQRIVDKKGGPEKIFNALMSGTKDGATTLRTVMRSLSPEDRPWVTATVIRRMGNATPGQQSADGDAFSLNTYLTNWNRLSPEAKGALFSGQDESVVAATNHIAKVAENVKSGSAVFANPSGTQPALTAQSTTVGAIAMLATGNIGPFASIVAGVLGANGTARIMTNPNFVNWLAKTTTIPAGGVPAAMNTLAQMAAQTQDDDLLSLVEALQQQ